MIFSHVLYQLSYLAVNRPAQRRTGDDSMARIADYQAAGPPNDGPANHGVLCSSHHTEDTMIFGHVLYCLEKRSRSKAGSGSISNDLGIVTVQEEPETDLVHLIGLGERKRLSHEA